MYCRSRTIAIETKGFLQAFPMRCKAWTCPSCAPKRRKKLIAEAIQGQPTGEIVYVPGIKFKIETKMYGNR